MKTLEIWGVIGTVLLCGALHPAMVHADAPATPVVTADTSATNLPSIWILGIAGALWQVDGNVRRAEQYVTPLTSGVSLLYQDANGTAVNEIILRDVGSSSGGGSFFRYSGDVETALQGQQRRSEFFRDWSDTGAPLTRIDTTLALDTNIHGSDLRISGVQTSLSDQSTMNPEDWTRTLASAELAGHTNGWLTKLGASYEAFTFNDNAPQNSGHEQTISLTLAPPESERTALQAFASLSLTPLNTGLVENTPRTVHLALEGTQLIGSSISLNGQLTHEDTADAITENGYARRDTGGQLSLDVLGIPHSALTLGGGLHLVGYVNALQTGITDAAENDLSVKFTSRLTKKLTFKASADSWWTNNRPASFDLIDQLQTGSLFWSSKKNQKAELSYNPSGNTGVSAQWRDQAWTNTDFATKNSIDSRSLFAWWMPKEQVTLYASYLRQDFDLSGTTDSALYPTNAGNDGTLGFSLQLSPRLWWDSSFTIAGGNGAEDTNQHITSLGIRYNWPSGASLSARAVLDSFTTSVNVPTSLNYQSHWYEVRLTKAIF